MIPDSWGHGGYPRSDEDDAGDSCFLGGGHDDHQSTEWPWTGVPAQQAEASTSLSVAKPNNIENDDQSEVNSFFYPARNNAL
jgi:hypothetical protein